MPGVADADALRQEWDERYRESDRVWSGRPNPTLVDEVADVAPGTALDAGAGEGADACWLAARGWRVTAVDLSSVAVERAAAHAAALGVDVTWRQLDLGAEPAPERYDLVTAHYLHVGGDRGRAIRDHLVDAVRPGGLLLVVAHAFEDERAQAHRAEQHAHDHVRDFGEDIWNAEALASHLDAGWRVEVAQTRTREATGADGETTTRYDSVLRARRL